MACRGSYSFVDRVFSISRPRESRFLISKGVLVPKGLGEEGLIALRYSLGLAMKEIGPSAVRKSRRTLPAALSLPSLSLQWVTSVFMRASPSSRISMRVPSIRTVQLFAGSFGASANTSADVCLGIVAAPRRGCGRQASVAPVPPSKSSEGVNAAKQSRPMRLLPWSSWRILIRGVPEGGRIPGRRRRAPRCRRSRGGCQRGYRIGSRAAGSAVPRGIPSPSGATCRPLRRRR